MPEKKILLIDDDETLLELLADHLQSAGFHPLTANGGLIGLALAEAEHPALVLLDVMMPRVDGWEIAKRLREKSSVPIIMLTAKDQEMDKLRGFKAGVDDYVTKPFSFAELVARINAVLARSSIAVNNNPIIKSSNLEINFDQRQVTVKNERIELTPTEFRLLQSLALRANQTVSTETILEEVWGPDYHSELTHVKNYIWSLRKKIETDPGDPRHILTERGFGYRFE